MKIILLTISIILLPFIFIRFLEHKSLYYPFKQIEMTPENIGLDYENVSVTTEDGANITGWFIPSESPRATLLFAHGNGGNISHRLEKIRMFNELNVNTFIFDYRGYGASDGSPSETGLYLDAKAAYTYLLNDKKIPAKQLVGYGESLGGTVVIDLAVHNELGGLIIESSFTSVRDMGKKIFPFIPAFLYKTNFDALSKIVSVKCPVLAFHSPEDEIVPYELGKQLFEAVPGPKYFIDLRGRHNDAFLVSEELFKSEIDLFIDRL
jgi:fermentation-respiration switch protein FrsA (DUF1100 family)